MSAVTGPVVKYPGGKWRIADWIIRHMPPHDTYLEPFFGSGAVFFRKKPARLETINDISGDVVNLFRVVREKPEELAAAVEMTPWAREEYYLSYDRDRATIEKTANCDPAVEAARRFLVRCWQGHGSRLGSSNGWRSVLQVNRGPTAVPYRQWKNVPGRILAATDRLKDAQIECRPAAEIITAYRLPEVLIYADPPYVLSTRDRKQYAHEMTDEDHEELLDLLMRHPGPVLISGYANPLYESVLSDWVRVETRTLAEKAKIREEVLWINPVAAEALDGRLFV
ncbi:MAG: DNA adenine methylase [Rubrobacteraceae bacterium]|nr:DNA adenine methylase [Rubrobacteraceae bacterium]